MKKEIKKLILEDTEQKIKMYKHWHEYYQGKIYETKEELQKYKTIKKELEME